MDANAVILTTGTREVPTGPTVSELMKDFYRGSDITPPTAQEISSLPPWTDEEATAFERTISEAFERVDEPSSLP